MVAPNSPNAATITLLNAARPAQRGDPTSGFVYATCYTITLFDGSTILTFTDANVDVVFGGSTWSHSGVQVDQRGSKAQAHWKRGLDVDQWVVVIAPRNTDPVTGTPFPDTILGQPWIAAARSGALDGADVQIDRAYFYSWFPQTGFDPNPAAINGIQLTSNHATALYLGSPSFATEPGVRSFASNASGKFYAKFHVNTISGAPGFTAVGVGNTLGVDFSTAIDTSGWLGATNNSIGVWDSGHVFVNSVLVATISGYTQGDDVYLAVDLTNKLLWARTNLGNWNNNPAADPAAGTNGISFAAVTGPFFLWFDPEQSNSATQVTMTDGVLPNMPAGFVQWNVGKLTPVGLVTVFAGRIAEVDTSDTIVVLTINDYRELLTQKMPRNVYLSQCRHTLYDSGCTLVANSFKVSLAAFAGSTQITLLAAATAPPGSGTFQLGKIKMTSGQNAGFSRTVHTWSAGTFLLLNPLPFPVTPGDTFDAFAGCDKLLATCNLFSNVANFGGEPYIPQAETAV